MSKPLVSVVIPVYNAASIIARTIDTVLNQTYQNIEIILVDDHSTDQSVDIIKDYTASLLQKSDITRNIKLIETKKNHGAYYVRNLGSKAAHGRFLCFLDADDLWISTKIEKQVNFMVRTKAAFSFTSYEFADCNGIRTGKIAHVPKKVTYKAALKNTIIFTSTVMFDLSQIDKSLVEMPSIESEDTATWWKILKTGYTAYGMQKVYTLYCRNSGTLSANKLKCIQRTWNLYRKCEGFGVLKSLYYFCFYAIHATVRRI